MKPGYSETLDSSTYQQALRQAGTAVENLAAGKDVAPEMVSQTRETLIDMLWVGAPATAPSNGLVTLYAYAKDGADGAELIGELAAAGPRAKEALTMIGQLEPSSTITSEEIRELTDHLHLSLENRLKLIADWLAEQWQRKDSPTDQPVPFSPVEAYGAAILPRQQFELVTESSKDKDTGDDRPPEAILNDPTLPQEQRLKAAIDLGPNAVPHLAKLLSNSDPIQREFAAIALNHLGRTDAAAFAVHEVARRAELDPALRLVGEHIRMTVEGRDQGDNPRARQGAKAASIGDKWLRSALDRCDAPSILKAAAGREMLALRLTARRLHELRAK